MAVVTVLSQSGGTDVVSLTNAAFEFLVCLHVALEFRLKLECSVANGAVEGFKIEVRSGMGQDLMLIPVDVTSEFFRAV